jgi:hypothetical protein
MQFTLIFAIKGGEKLVRKHGRTSAAFEGHGRTFFRSGRKKQPSNANIFLKCGRALEICGRACGRAWGAFLVRQESLYDIRKLGLNSQNLGAMLQIPEAQRALPHLLIQCRKHAIF